MKLIKGSTSITDIIGLRHADHKADLLILKKSNARALRKQRLNVQMCCLTCEEYVRRHTRTNSWSWVITRECCMVHQYSIRQTSWIFISLFTLPEWQTRQKPFHWDMSLAQSNTLWHRHGHTRWFTYTDKSLRQAVKGAHILTHTHKTSSKKKVTWHTDGIDNNFAFLTRKQTHPPPSLSTWQL